ncbi:tRNA (adenosine(37)-N6)-threonylcarbamoyltransferase complex ATPase subunit type 1 TsaE [bacterium]|nr:tRNA (adenosine(37)-N6)-threonylcarbamoyltransferase complex ATPase subunit type 1 TsaE [bacterium]
MGSFFSYSEKETREFASGFAKLLNPGDCIDLVGAMGAGKTAFVKGIAESYGFPSADVSSPSYSLINEYEFDGLEMPVWHLDLYRLESVDSLEDLGLDPYEREEGAVFLEWPERLSDLTWRANWKITITPRVDLGENVRHIEWVSQNIN